MALGKLAEAIIGPAVGGVATAITQGGPRRQYKWNKKAAEDANRMNRENQQWLLQQQESIQREQREYDSPQAQMGRYLAAGLNPHLIYGNGSSAGSAFPIDAGSVPGVNIQAPSAAYPDVVGGYLGAAQSMAQTQLLGSKSDESVANRALKEAQTRVALTNPMLDPYVAHWVSEGMISLAQTKSEEYNAWWTKHYDKGDGSYYQLGSEKIRREVESLSQRLGLNTADLAIKNKILESKEFENAIKEVQAQWLKDGDVSPEHIRQALMLFLGKMTTSSK